MNTKIELSELQDIVYYIFKDFARVCEKYEIKYSMEGGTLLGAAKFGDFVPWDDDIDVIMLRSEYEKFLKVAPHELSPDLFLQSYNNISEFPLNYAKICYKNSIINDYCYSHLKNMCHGVFVDIFPIDYIVPKKLKKQLHLIGLLTGARKTKLKVKLGRINIIKKVLYKTIALLPMHFLCKAMNYVCTRYNRKDTGYCYEVCNSNKNFKPLRSDMYKNLTFLKFRDGEYQAVKEYDEFLKSRFGSDYMTKLPSEEKRKPSHNQNIIILGDTKI